MRRSDLEFWVDTWRDLPVLLQRQKKHIFLHCNASNLVLEILQHDKIWEDNPPAPNSRGDLYPRPL